MPRRAGGTDSAWTGHQASVYPSARGRLRRPRRCANSIGSSRTPATLRGRRQGRWLPRHSNDRERVVRGDIGRRAVAERVRGSAIDLDGERHRVDPVRENERAVRSDEQQIASQRAEGWLLVRDRYDDGGFSGGTLDRPALQRLLADIEQGLIDVIVVYKIDRLSRSLMDFAKLVEAFEAHGVTFVSVT